MHKMVWRKGQQPTAKACRANEVRQKPANRDMGCHNIPTVPIATDIDESEFFNERRVCGPAVTLKRAAEPAF